jgi:hypothetical protein
VDKDGIKESLIGLPFFFFVLFLSEEEEGGATRKDWSFRDGGKREPWILSG